jgi:hypothetical protein
MSAPSVHCHVLVEPSARKPSASTGGEIRVFSRVRNERLRLPAFLNHYRGLGVDRFFVIDNGSSDGTSEYLADQPDVRVFRTRDGFRESRDGTDWLNALLAEFGVGFWCLAVDIDELLIYPGSETASLRALTAYLDQRGHDVLFCLLLDLYPAGPLKASPYNPGDDLVAAAPCFDAGPYKKSPFPSCPGVLVKGGMRERVFYPEFESRGIGARIFDAMLYRVALRTPLLRNLPSILALRRPAPPCLTKVPLVRWDRTSKYLHSTHWVSSKTVAPETGVLLHFKFLHDFHARAVQEVARNEHYNESAEYRRYVDKLAQNPDMTLSCDQSVRLEDTNQLVRLGLMQDTKAWAGARHRGI